MTGSRILVQRGVAGQVRSRLAGLLENVRVGDGLDPSTDMGPLIDKADVTRVDGMVQAGLAYAKPIVRGGPATDGALAAGAFYRPALLEVEDVSTDIVQKEVFGPVATFEVFDTETDAIARANATEYGLAAGIFTSSINTSRRLLDRARQGGRADDVAEVIQHRLVVYAETTGPLVRYYTERGILVAVDAGQPPDSVTAGIRRGLECQEKDA